MKKIRSIILIALAVALVFSLGACTKKNPVGPGTVIGTNLTPNVITKLNALTDYGSKTTYYNATVVSYSSYSGEQDYIDLKANLAARILQKRNDYNNLTSSPVKIFAKSDADEIINRMGTAALSYAKMKATVEYLAGDPDKDVTDQVIIDLVASNRNSFAASATDGWSLFDDYSYYEKLQDKADETNEDVDKDNVKRQYRNICRKVFNIGLSGDEFGRLVMHEMNYAIDIVENETGSGVLGGSEFATYVKNEYDYDTLVYFLAYNKLADEGAAKVVQLYGYYYDYNHNTYNAVSDVTFEKQLKYSHMTVYLDSEWLDYMAINRALYTSAYRYTDAFIKTFYITHYNFQGYVEDFEREVYDINEVAVDTSSTGELKKSLNYLPGQLNVTDWEWCYNGDEATMKAYNQANTAYQKRNEGKKSQADKDLTEFNYNQEQTKMSAYILEKVPTSNKSYLNYAMSYEIYSYSASVIRTRQSYLKTRRLIDDGKEEPDFYISYILDTEDAGTIKSYSLGKIDSIVAQVDGIISKVDAANKVSNVSQNANWSGMLTELKAVLNEENYTTCTTGTEKLEKQGQLLIKKQWSCCNKIVGEDDDTCTKTGSSLHSGEQDYYTKHNISKFASSYDDIMYYTMGKSRMTFMRMADDKCYYMRDGSVDTLYNPGFNGSLLTAEVNAANKKSKMICGSDGNYVGYSKITTDDDIMINTGKGFYDGVSEESTANNKAWTTVGTKSADFVQHVKEAKYSSTPEANYDYAYTFKGWYLGQDLSFRLEVGQLCFALDNEGNKIVENGRYKVVSPSYTGKKEIIQDNVNCDLTLYAGYACKKTASLSGNDVSWIVSSPMNG